MNNRFDFRGTAPSGSGSTTLYDTTADGVSASSAGIRRFVYTIAHSHSGTVVGEFQQGSTWYEFYSQAHTGSAIARGDERVEEFEHFRFRWVNGGTAQDPFAAALATSDDGASSD